MRSSPGKPHPAAIRTQGSLTGSLNHESNAVGGHVPGDLTHLEM